MLYFTYAMMLLHTFVGVILIGVILLQRGRGGGLAGAFGGMGGQSAFGTKAGDVFTKITIVLATVWIVLGCVCVLLASNSRSERFKAGTAVDVKTAPAGEDMKDETPGTTSPGEKMPAEDGGAAPAKPAEGAKPDAKAEEGAKSDESAKPEPKPEEKAEPKPDAKDAAADKPAETEKKEDAAKESTDKKPE